MSSCEKRDIESLPDVWNLLVLATLALLCAGCAGCHASTPLARKGVIDLSRIDLLNCEPIRLDGQWAFYWKRLLTPVDFRWPHPPAVSSYLTLPGAWNNVQLNGEVLGGEGYATFRLQVLAGPMHGGLAVRLRGVNSAYRLWTNGKLLMENGEIGKDLSEETPDESIQLALLPVDGWPVDLVLEVSNHHYREGGVVSSVEIGPPMKLEYAQL